MGVEDIDAALRGSRWCDAEALCRRQLASSPGSAAIHGRLGRALLHQARTDEALVALARAAGLAPEAYEHRYFLGNALLAAGRIDEAVRAYGHAVRLNPDCGEAWCNLGVALRAAGKAVDAVAAAHRAAELLPEAGDVHANLGVALDAVGRRVEAVAAYRRALAVDAGSGESWYNLGNSLAATGELDAAVGAYTRALELRPGFVPALGNLGTALTRLGRGAEALAVYERGIGIEPESPDLRWNRALALLQQGDYARGWGEYEWRQRLTPPSADRFVQPQWQGEELAGRTILLHDEHGLGDTVQFARYVPRVAALGGRVLLRVQRELVELLKELPGVAGLLTVQDPLPPFELHCPLMSLPHAFGTREATIPGQVPYLRADPARVAVWEGRLGPRDGRPRIGLCWAGRAEHQYDRERSIPLALLEPLGRAQEAHFISLQKGPAAGQIGSAEAGMKVAEYGSCLGDYADTAALIAHLDLVIAVDTSVAHVAGALGKPTWLLLAFAPDWRWLLEREDSPWYPTMRLFRQKTRGDWRPVVEAVSRALQESR